MAHTRLYRGGTLEAENFPVDDIPKLAKADDATVWVDFTSPSQEEIGRIGEHLGLHQLAIENAAESAQRPKLTRYDSHLFFVAYDLDLDVGSGALGTGEIKAFITQKVFVTVHEDGFNVDALTAQWDDNKDLAVHGVGFLLWGLLDLIVDAHFDTVQQMDAGIEELEDALFDDKPHTTEVQRRSFELRKSLVLMRRVVLPMREVLNTLLRGDLNTFDDVMVPYVHDVYDHVLRVTEWTDSLRDLVTTVLETNVSIQGNRMNLVMKKVTSWAAIIAVPTAITGFYGQNLTVPGLNSVAGFWTSSALIVVASVGLYTLFRKNDWL